MRHLGRTVWVAMLGLSVALGAACEPTPKGTLALYWSINGETGAGACSAADVTHVRVLVDNTRAEPDGDPLSPTWHYADFACSDDRGTLKLTEGIYRVRIVAIRDQVEVRSQVVELLDVEVIDDEITSVPLNPDLEPPVDIEVAICGDGVLQAGEYCDASDLGGNDCESLGGSGGVLLCASDCTFDDSGCTECGDEVIEGSEACDGSELGGETCQSLGFDGGTLLCDNHCQLDTTGCLAQGDLTVTWSVFQSNGSSPSSCAAQAITDVEVTVTVAGVGTVAHQSTTSCTPEQLVIPDLGFGLYSVALSGTDASGLEQAAGSSAVVDHTNAAGTTVDVDLVEL